jgi:hypothetical protein
MNHGKPRPVLIQPEDTSIRLIALTRGFVVKVDVSDYEDLMCNLWGVMKCRDKWYAYRTHIINGQKTSLLLHRYLLGLTPGDGIVVDHDNGDGLDCRRDNLRKGGTAENGQNRGIQANNTSGFKGVTPYRYNPEFWVAQIKAFGKHKHLGLFREKEKAARAYDEAAIRLHGRYARLNFPEEHPTSSHARPRAAQPPPTAPIESSPALRL